MSGGYYVDPLNGDTVVRIPNPKNPDVGDVFLDSFGGRRTVIAVTSQHVIATCDDNPDELITSRHGAGYWRQAPPHPADRWRIEQLSSGHGLLYDGQLVVAYVYRPTLDAAVELVTAANIEQRQW